LPAGAAVGEGEGEAVPWFCFSGDDVVASFKLLPLVSGALKWGRHAKHGGVHPYRVNPYTSDPSQLA